MAKILIAEDERPISELVKRNLMLVGHTAAQAFDGPCALEMAGAERFDLVLLDVMLPGCSGFEVKEQLDPALPREEQVLLQGVIDCAFLERGRFTVLDFKTDAKDPEALAERYRPQLRLYARAVELMTGIPCGECLLYSFHRGREIVVE